MAAEIWSFGQFSPFEVQKDSWILRLLVLLKEEETHS